MDELKERLALLEMRLLAIAREIRNINGMLVDTSQARQREQRDLNFFTALQADDDLPINDEYTASTRQ